MSSRVIESDKIEERTGEGEQQQQQQTKYVGLNSIQDNDELFEV
ncbi:11461_t:CDS:1, partial [Ambispora gerdemannii]